MQVRGKKADQMRPAAGRRHLFKASLQQLQLLERQPAQLTIASTAAPQPAVHGQQGEHLLPRINIQLMRRVVLQRPALGDANPLDELRRDPARLLPGAGTEVPVQSALVTFVTLADLEQIALGDPDRSRVSGSMSLDNNVLHLPLPG